MIRLYLHRHCPYWWLPANNHRRLGCGASSSAVNPSSQNLTILTICWSVVGQFPLSPLVSIICKLQQKYQCVSLPILPVHCCISETPTQHMYLSRIKKLYHTFSNVHGLFHHWCRCCLVRAA